MKRPTYRAAVQWIADNDDASEMDAGVVEKSLTAALVADLFSVETKRVARHVVKQRAAILDEERERARRFSDMNAEQSARRRR